MRVGVPAEVKNRETRVALTPAGVEELVGRGHEVVVQAGAGQGSRIDDAHFEASGARLVDREAAWDCDLVLKVKEPVEEEYGYLGRQTLFTFLHLAANAPLARALVQAGTTALSYDTVQEDDGALPLLKPMSEVAGRLATFAGAHHLMSPYGGRGVLLSGVSHAPGAKVTVIGAGIAGSRAASQAASLGAQLCVLDLNEARLDQFAREHGSAQSVRTVVSTPEAVEREVLESDLVIGAVLIPGKRAPQVISHDLATRMRPGAVIVDIAIDQGGCCEDSRPTTHDDPIFTVAETVMYCVTNMPAAVGATATQALTTATLPYVCALASGWEGAVAADAALARGLNVAGGALRHPAVAEAFPDLPVVAEEA